MFDKPRRGRRDLFPSTKVDTMLENVYSMSNNYIVAFYAWFQLESQINK